MLWLQRLRDSALCYHPVDKHGLRDCQGKQSRQSLGIGCSTDSTIASELLSLVGLEILDTWNFVLGKFYSLYFEAFDFCNVHPATVEPLRDIQDKYIEQDEYIEQLCLR